MSKNYSQLRLGSITRSAGRVACMFASAVILYGSAVSEARAQQITVGSSNLMPSARSTKPVLTFSLPQDLPAGILFELDCKKPRTRGKAKGKATREKSPGNE